MAVELTLKSKQFLPIVCQGWLSNYFFIGVVNVSSISVNETPFAFLLVCNMFIKYCIRKNELPKVQPAWENYTEDWPNPPCGLAKTWVRTRASPPSWFCFCLRRATGPVKGDLFGCIPEFKRKCENWWKKGASENPSKNRRKTIKISIFFARPGKTKDPVARPKFYR